MVKFKMTQNKDKYFLCSWNACKRCDANDWFRFVCVYFFFKMAALTFIIDSELLVFQLRHTNKNLILETIETVQVRFDGKHLV